MTLFASWTACHPYVTRMSSVCHSYILLCHSYVLVCHSYVTRMYSFVIRMYSYVIRMSLVCTRMSPVCHSYVLVCHLCVTRMYSYFIRMLLVCTRMSFVCHLSVVFPWTVDCYSANKYFIKTNNRNTKKRCEICSKLRIETPEERIIDTSFWWHYCFYCWLLADKFFGR